MSNNCLTLGSLFDGSGGFLLGGLLSGIRPVWKSEIEPFPIAVTNKRFPDVKHYGDVSKLNGAEIEHRGYNHVRQSLSGYEHCREKSRT